MSQMDEMKAMANFLTGGETADAKLLTWVEERRANCERIAKSKSGADRAGWMEDERYFAAILTALRRGRHEASPRLWKTRLDCWYEAHRDPGAKARPNERVVCYVKLEAPDSDAAIKRATDWADSHAPGGNGRKLLAVEHRSTAPVTLPLRVPE